MADTTEDKYDRKTISNDPADYITGPRGGEGSRTHGGTTRDGAVQVVRREEPDEQ